MSWLVGGSVPLVMGPGGYKFADYVKIGIPLTIVVFLVVLVLLPILWPLA